MRVVRHESPNWNERPAGAKVSAVVIHADASGSAAASASWCCAPKSVNPNPVSYHLIVERDGTVHHLVPPAKRAWHAGVSALDGVGNVNDFSIGVCLSNRQDGKERFTVTQYQVAAALVASFLLTYNIPLERVVGHESIALPFGRKHDPGNLFDWPAFRRLVLQELGK